MKKFLVVALGALFVASVNAEIVWSTSGQFLNDSDGVLLPGNTSADSTTGFIQLVSLGNFNTETDVFDLNYDYSVVATSWVGEGNNFFAPTEPGKFTAASVTDYTVGAGEDFAILVYDTASSDYASGIAPLSGNYGFQLFINPAKQGDDYNLNITSDLLTTMAVPEPATLLIFGPGIAGLLGYRRRKDSVRNQLRDMFERRQILAEQRKEKEGSVREQASYMGLLRFFDKREKSDHLGDLLLAVDNRLS